MSDDEREQRIKELAEKDRRIRELEAQVQQAGARLAPTFAPSTPPPARGLSALRRWGGIFKAPGITMSDIARAPNYAEPGAIVLLEAILGGIAVGVAMGKMEITGPYAGAVMSRVSAMLAGSVVLAGVLMFLFWAIRAGIILALCRGDSGWQFKSVAAVAGYALIPGLLITVLSLIIMASALPAVVIDTGNLAATEQAVAAFGEQTAALKLSMTVPLTLAGNAWGAYLGGLGVNAGTRGRCSAGGGFAAFFAIGLVDLLLIVL